MHSVRQVAVRGNVACLLQGVNLPAYLVIIKGTQRYCSEGGKGLSSYQEYEQGECLQMIGRAGALRSATQCVHDQQTPSSLKLVAESCSPVADPTGLKYGELVLLKLVQVVPSLNHQRRP